MAQGNNKPDLSDLKARLGLKKPSPAKTAQSTQDSAQAVAERAPAPAGPARSQPPAGGPPLKAQGGPPATSAPPSATGPAPGGPPTPAAGPPQSMTGPPAGVGPGPAASPPPAAQPEPAPIAEAASASTTSARQPSMDVSFDADDFKTSGGAGVFSPKFLGLFVILLVIGLIFGWAAASSGNSSKLYNSQTADALRIQEALESKIANFEEANSTISKLSASEIDFEAAASLAKADFAIDGNVIKGDRLLLGASLIDKITGYTVDSNMLKTMLAEHDRMTNKVDRKELEELKENNELLDKDRFAILFNYDYLAKNSGNDNYVPGSDNRLVTVTSMEKDEEGRIEVALLNSGETANVHVQNILPLEKDEILKTSGPDALARYKSRVEHIKHAAAQLDNRTSPLMSNLKQVSSRDKAGLF